LLLQLLKLVIKLLIFAFSDLA